ncbi:hypothetical protein HYN24_00795 [Dechloromonas sp. HYN0024]|nr:hypothetical protein HYN24_00795 [Dechloromonas sp. HYN0024]
MPHFLILSHGFNMDGRAASQTITDKLPFLSAHGVHLSVLSAVTGIRDKAVTHQQLLPWGPSGLRFDLRHMLRLRIGKGFAYRMIMLVVSIVLLPLIVLERALFGLQSQWSWAFPAAIRGALMLRKTAGTVVYSTGGAYSAHLAAYWLKRWLGAPWIAEIHDPMVRPGQVPQTRDQRFQAWLEKMICTHADRVWWFTEGALRGAQARNPQLAARGFVVFPGANPPTVQASYRRGEQLVFAHFGSLDATRSLAPFVRTLGQWLQRYPERRRQIRVDIYGGALDTDSSKLAETLGIESLMVCHGRLEACPESGLSGRERVMIKMHEADCLLLMHGMIPECPEYIPSKVYEYFWTRRPVLALTWRNPQLDRLVIEHGGYVAPTDDQAAILNGIDSIYADWSAGCLTMTPEASPPLGVEQAVRRILDECGTAGLVGENK